MNKTEFLAAICAGLSGLPQNIIDQSLEYYSEMIDDRMEDGMTEEEAVLAMGSVDDIVTQILFDTPLPRLVRAKARPSHTLRAWEIVLLVLGSPVWIPLLFAAVMIILAIYIVIWSVVISFYAIDLSFAAAGIAGFAAGLINLFAGNWIQVLIQLGAGMVCIGLSILLFFAFNQVTRSITKLSRWILLSIKSVFIRKGDTK